jgi:hypothetical protein
MVFEQDGRIHGCSSCAPCGGCALNQPATQGSRQGATVFRPLSGLRCAGSDDGRSMRQSYCRRGGAAGIRRGISDSGHDGRRTSEQAFNCPQVSWERGRRDSKSHAISVVPTWHFDGPYGTFRWSLRDISMVPTGPGRFMARNPGFRPAWRDSIRGYFPVAPTALVLSVRFHLAHPLAPGWGHTQAGGVGDVECGTRGGG